MSDVRDSFQEQTGAALAERITTRETIELRQEAAYRAVLAWNGSYRRTGDDHADMDTQIGDLLVDLLHLADQYGGATEALEVARAAYEADSEGMR